MKYINDFGHVYALTNHEYKKQHKAIMKGEMDEFDTTKGRLLCGIDFSIGRVMPEEFGEDYRLMNKGE